jgi:GTP-binding protein EngB required for normal cell division
MSSDEQNAAAAISPLSEGAGLPASANGGIDGADRLWRLAALAADLGAGRIEEQAKDLAARIAEGRFYVACIGQFKRGKSTLINALIGDPVLPVGFTPVTAVPTVIRFGELRRARIQARDGSWQEVNASDLKQYVSEECNPENSKGVRGVEVFDPSPLLAGGMCLVDTPGLGSVFTGNTAATQAFIPHIDAALVVIGADPPLAGEELDLVEAVSHQVENIVLVLNKADRTTAEERAAAVSFAARQLERRLGRTISPIFEASAAERLDQRGPERDWQKLLVVLERWAEESGRQVIYSACKRGIRRLSEQLLAILCEEKEALERPVEESQRRIELMKTTITEAERSMRELGILLLAEQQRLSDLFVDRHKIFVAAVLPQATKDLDDSIAAIHQGAGPGYRRRIMKQAQEIARLRVLPWLQPEQEEGERQYRQASLRFVEMGNDFLKRLAEAGVPELARLPHALDPEIGFRVRSRFTFKDFIELAQPASPLRWLADLALGLIGARAVIQKQGQAFLENLVAVNSTRVQADILARVQESRGQLEIEIRKLLHEVSRIAEQALNNAKATQEKGAPAVHAALERLNGFEREVAEVAGPNTASRKVDP